MLIEPGDTVTYVLAARKYRGKLVRRQGNRYMVYNRETRRIVAVPVEKVYFCSKEKAHVVRRVYARPVLRQYAE